MPAQKLSSMVRPSLVGFQIVVLFLCGWATRIAGGEATPAEKLATAPGFKIELIRTAQPGEGSWVALATDNKGRLIVSPQHGRTNGIEGGLLRFTLGAD